MKHKSLRLAVTFSVAVFLIMTVTMGILGLSAIFLMHAGLLQNRNPLQLIVYFMLVSIIFGTFLSRFVGHQMFKPIFEINDATKEIAKGNFDVVINTRKNGPKEILEMTANFNIMAQELQNTEIFHNDFVNNVSHEFKTPLSAIEGYATLMQDKQLSENKQQQYVDKIIYNSQRLTSLIGNILTLSRLENQTIITGKKSFSLDEQLRENILLFESEWSKKDIELDIEMDTVNFFGSEELLSQVWQNLIGNAVKFVRSHGFIHISLEQKDNQVIVRVTDNGIGMTEEVQKRIFDKFYQGDTSHSAEGNGLGLALAMRIINLHKGTIEISSQINKGSTFTVKLPLLDISE